LDSLILINADTDLKISKFPTNCVTPRPPSGGPAPRLFGKKNFFLYKFGFFEIGE